MVLPLLIANIYLLSVLLAAITVVAALAALAAWQASTVWSWWWPLVAWIAEGLTIAFGFPLLVDLMEGPAAFLAVMGFWLVG